MKENFDDTLFASEDEVERQNVVTAAHAPVRGVTAGGGTGVEAADPFLMGFDSAWQ